MSFKSLLRPNFNTDKSQHLSSLGLSLLLLAALLYMQYWRATNIAPLPESIWDNVYVWDWARWFSMGDFSSFRTDSHHLMRWGIWLPTAVFIEFFDDEILTYYLATLVPSTLAIAIFVFLAQREISFWAAVALLALWFFDALLLRASFQLLPSGHGLLPLALIVWFLVHIGKSGAEWTLGRITVMALLCFWLYGTKETHLAFLPGILWLVFAKSGWRPILWFMGLFIGLYAFETLAFKIIHGEFSWGGRIVHLMDGGQHINIMTGDKNYVAQQTRFFDSGITMRWVRTSGTTPVLMFLAYFTALIVCARLSTKSSQESFSRLLSVLMLSFLFFTTFFIISIDPLRLGHGLVPRYATLAVPIAYLLILAFVKEEFASANKATLLGVLALIPFYVAPAIDRYKHYATRNVVDVSANFTSFAKNLKRFECVRADQRSILMNNLDLIPFKYRDERLTRLITDDSLVYKDTERGGYLVKTQHGKECQSMFSIPIKVPARY